MPIALDPKSTFTFILAEDRELPEDQRTIFELRGLTVSEEAQVSDSMLMAHSGTDEVAFRAGTHQLTVLRYGLRGWENFLDAAGQAVAYETTKGHPKVVTDGCLDRLLPKHRQELVQAILDRGEINSDEGN